jgi:DNA polymerase II small subunit
MEKEDYDVSGEASLEGVAAVSERIQKAVTLAITAGYQLDKEAFNFLKTMSQTRDPVKLIEEIVKRIESLPEKPLFISRPFLEEAGKEFFTKREDVKKTLPSLIEPKRVFRAYAKDIESDVKVIEDPTDKIGGTGSIEEYIEYFRDRFTRIQKFLRRRMDAKDAIPISAALKASLKSRVKIICMITEKREYKQRLILRIEDLEASAVVLISPRAPPEVSDKARRLLLDQVVCISVIKGRNDLLIAEDFIWPDIPQRKPRQASIPVYAALISDLHVGSKMFMSEAFNRFILWLNGKFGNKNLRTIASQIKYVVIAGDLVEGIGVYPGQIETLARIDIYDQYRAVSKLLEQIPEYIEVILIPGNHDVSRKALPQPALPRDYAEPIYEVREVRSLGNPSVIQLHGVELLLYHGQSFDELISTIPDLSFYTLDKALKFLLQSRHLAPIYGEKTPISPEKRDFLVIERAPDIFHSGHMHVLKYDTYRGTLMLNSGAWQEQTEYQRRMQLIPTPGIAPIVNLQTLEVTPIDFTS